jgi:hypothetical protein
VAFIPSIWDNNLLLFKGGLVLKIACSTESESFGGVVSDP